LGAIGIGILSLLTVPPLILKILVIILLIKISVLICYGIWNAFYPRIQTYSLNAPLLKDKWGDKKIVLFSDVHLGMVRREKWMQQIVTMVTNLKPDIVLIAGDLIDGPVFPYETGLAPLQNLKSTYGTFYTAGNHDEYNRDQEKYYAELAKYVTVLNDKKVVVNDTQIVGIIYAMESLEKTMARLSATGYQKNTPSMVLLHDPKNVAALSQSNVTLSLSGHTHGGQFFPFTLLVQSIYKNLTKGIHYIGNMAHLTSVGVGTAGPLMRLGTTPEIAVIEII
jgi:predicted MPP superfamily phosphohydrolase